MLDQVGGQLTYPDAVRQYGKAQADAMFSQFASNPQPTYMSGTEPYLPANPMNPAWQQDVMKPLTTEGSTYGNILPYERDAQGELSWGLPNMARDMLSSFGEIVAGPQAAYEGRIDPMNMTPEQHGDLMMGLLDFGGASAFAPRVPNSLGSFGGKMAADLPAGEVMPYADVPIIDPRDLIGAKISHTPADLTKAGDFYEGIDAAGTTRETPLLGGPLFPLQKEYADKEIAWAVQGGPTAIQKLNNDADYVAVSAMGQLAHQSNASIADAYMGTLEAHIKDGRLPEESVDALNNLVRNSAKQSVDPEIQKLENFVGFNDPLYNEYQSGLTFPQRAAISKLMATPTAQKIGGPNFQKILDKTIQTEFAGTNLGDMLMLLEIDKKRGVLDLAAEGAPTHPSYKHGVGGKVVGRFENPISRDLLLPEKVNEYSSRPTMRDENGNIIQSRLNYSLGKSRSPETVTPESARNMMEAIQYQNINNPRQASLIQDAMNSNWKSSYTAKNAGGVSHIDYERALKRNPSLPSLEPYNVADLKAGKKGGDFEVQQLGDSDIYFGLKKNPDYTWMNDGNPIPELGDNEVSLVGVISNEAAGKGVASPAVLGKAIEDGATVLDAFAVPSKKYPDGFLPEVYGDYGFDEVKRIPFSKDFYIEDRGQKAYDDLVYQWRSEGWDESKGFPDVLLMKWNGTDGQRTNASKRVFDESFEGFGSGEGRGIIPQTSGDARQISGATSGQKANVADNGRSNLGQARDNSGSRKPNRIRSASTELGNLTPLQRQNLGLLGAVAKTPK